MGVDATRYATAQEAFESCPKAFVCSGRRFTSALPVPGQQERAGAGREGERENAPTAALRTQPAESTSSPSSSSSSSSRAEAAPVEEATTPRVEEAVPAGEPAVPTALPAGGNASPPEPDLSQVYRCVHKAQLRRGRELDSAKCGTLSKGRRLVALQVRFACCGRHAQDRLSKLS